VNRRYGQEGSIYPERPPENHMDFRIDGITGATQEAWDRQEGIQIRVGGNRLKYLHHNQHKQETKLRICLSPGIGNLASDCII